MDLNAGHGGEARPDHRDPGWEYLFEWHLCSFRSSVEFPYTQVRVTRLTSLTSFVL